MTPERRAPARPVTPQQDRAEQELGAPAASWPRGSVVSPWASPYVGSCSFNGPLSVWLTYQLHGPVASDFARWNNCAVQIASQGFEQVFCKYAIANMPGVI